MLKGEIWLINLDPAIGAEIRKTRPAVIVSADAIGVLPLRVIVPLTDWKDRYSVAPWLVRIDPDETNGLSKTSAADAFQIRPLSQERFVDRVGQIAEQQMDAILNAICVVLGL